MEVARLLGGGSLTGLDRLIVTTGENPVDGVVASGLAGYLDDGGRRQGRRQRLVRIAANSLVANASYTT